MTGMRTTIKLRQLNRALARRNVPGDRRRQILRDLKPNLQAAAADIGERQALAQLGDLDAMAAEYLTGTEEHRLRFRSGLILAGIAMAALVTLTLIRIPTFGTIEVFDRHTGATAWHEQFWRLGEMSGDAQTDTLFEATVYSYAYLIFGLAAFIVGAQFWRPLIHRRHGSEG